MMSAREAAKSLLRHSPGAAPITWSQLASATGVRSAATAKRAAESWVSSVGDWISAADYERERVRAGHADWPPALALVPPSLEELLSRQRPQARQRPASGSLTVRPARLGERYRTWNYGHRDRVATDGDARVRSHSKLTNRSVVLLAHEGRRLVGSTAFYFADTLDMEQVDVPEVMGPVATGPFFTEGDHDWGGHVIVMDSMWVASDRRRAGIARAMGDRVAEIGLPGWGQFRDPWFAAFFLHRWPPTRPLIMGSYWPVFGAYLDAVDSADENDVQEAQLELYFELSSDELLVMTSDSADFVHLALTPEHEVRDELADGAVAIEVHHARARRARGRWTVVATVSLTYIDEPLRARAALEAYLAAPFGAQAPVETLAQAIELAVIAPTLDLRSAEGLASLSWRPAAPVERT